MYVQYFSPYFANMHDAFRLRSIEKYHLLVRDLTSGWDGLLDFLRDVEALDLLTEVPDFFLDPLLYGETAEQLRDPVLDVDGSLAADAFAVLVAVPWS